LKAGSPFLLQDFCKLRQSLYPAAAHCLPRDS
jgi:hypothetical protein